MENNPIKITYTGFDGADHEAFIYPLKRKEGILVYHRMMSVFASLQGDNAIAIFKAMSGEDLIYFCETLLRYATIDSKEFKGLDSFDGFNGHFEDIYTIVFKCLEINFPDFFAKMGESDLIGSTGQKADK